MQIVNTCSELRRLLKAEISVAFVPTMGNLHAGHLHLVALAKQQASCVVVSIFVNPLQFGPNEDLANYPRTLAADCEKLAEVNADIVFVPTVSELYIDFDGVNLNQTMTIQPPPIASELCGASRPGHFMGVATVVMKLFNIVQPDVAVFGKKDYQQLHIIRELVKQFNLPIYIVAGETIREANGLALSSRNGYLEINEKVQATQLIRVLNEVVSQVTQGSQDFVAIEAQAMQQLTSLGWEVDYIAIRSVVTLLKATVEENDLIVLGAAWLGKTRLIDNIEFCAKPLN
ncbi:MAG: pantoate--beta-alanine ligase [Methylophilus sp.]|nr:pantoate--beta-alanine ligase [Methylophilus sp.]